MQCPICGSETVIHEMPFALRVFTRRDPRAAGQLDFAVTPAGLKTKHCTNPACDERFFGKEEAAVIDAATAQVREKVPTLLQLFEDLRSLTKIEGS